MASPTAAATTGSSRRSMLKRNRKTCHYCKKVATFLIAEADPNTNEHYNFCSGACLQQFKADIFMRETLACLRQGSGAPDPQQQQQSAESDTGSTQPPAPKTPKREPVSPAPSATDEAAAESTAAIEVFERAATPASCSPPLQTTAADINFSLGKAGGRSSSKLPRTEAMRQRRRLQRYRPHPSYRLNKRYWDRLRMTGSGASAASSASSAPNPTPMSLRNSHSSKSTATACSSSSNSTAYAVESTSSRQRQYSHSNSQPTAAIASCSATATSAQQLLQQLHVASRQHDVVRQQQPARLHHTAPMHHPHHSHLMPPRLHHHHHAPPPPPPPPLAMHHPLWPPLFVRPQPSFIPVPVPVPIPLLVESDFVRKLIDRTRKRPRSPCELSLD